MLEEAVLAQPLDHAADRGRRELEEIGDLARSRGPPLRRKPVNGLEIILYGPGEWLVLDACVHPNFQIRNG